MIRTLVALTAALALAMALPGPAQAAPQDRYAQNGPVKIHYAVEGQGPLVVLIHGYPDYSGSWARLTSSSLTGWAPANS